MKKGQVYEGVIDRVEFPNHGKIAVLGEEKEVTVKNGVPGQKVRFSINKVRKGKAEGRILEVICPSDMEIESPCPHFGQCGGCTYQTLPYDEQLKLKEAQLKEMLENTARYAKYPLFLAVDEEGGTVSRIGSSIGPKTDSAGAIGETGNPENAYQAGAAMGTALYGLGFNVDFAPVADLANVEGSIMEGRAYGSDVSVVSSFVNAMVRGLQEQKVSACLKHFPGMGSATEDTHDGKVSTDRTAEQFWAEELAVFQAGINEGADMVMVSHMAAPTLTGDNEPSIFSRTLVTGILREQMGFQGVIITDALDMGAISQYYAADEASIMAVLAGCDMLLMPEDYEKAYTGVLEAVRSGNIDEERINDSLRRIYRIKYADMVQ